MKISEAFYSIQGEGRLAGVPSLFLRVSGCNLRCAWCDTPYTSWRPEGEEWPLERMLEFAASQKQARHVVLTGGEPMLFGETVELARGLRGLGLHLTIETAGTVFQPVECDLMSISPKLSNSTPEGEQRARHERARMAPDVLRRLVAGYDYQLKFVVSAENDLAEVISVVEMCGGDRGRVLLMPEGTRPEVLRDRAVWLVEVCKREGFVYCPRLHVELYGDRRGV